MLTFKPDGSVKGSLVVLGVCEVLRVLCEWLPPIMGPEVKLIKYHMNSLPGSYFPTLSDENPFSAPLPRELRWRMRPNRSLHGPRPCKVRSWKGLAMHCQVDLQLLWPYEIELQVVGKKSLIETYWIRINGYILCKVLDLLCNARELQIVLRWLLLATALLNEEALSAVFNECRRGPGCQLRSDPSNAAFPATGWEAPLPMHQKVPLVSWQILGDWLVACGLPSSRHCSVGVFENPG